MLVSVHITTFCQADSGWLERAIKSILSQTYKNFELVCYDDGSYDGTAEILNRFADADHRVRVITGTENVNSVSKSLGRCFLERNPKTGAITWMFDDNILEPDALQILVEKMDQTNADVVYGQTRVLIPDGSSWLIGARDPEIVGASFETTSADVPNAGILINPEVFDRAGWYDPNIILRRSCDWDLFRRIWETTDRIVKVDHVCATEYGELSETSLRNSFDTSFPIMKKYVSLRDGIGFRLNVLDAVYGPCDLIPSGSWTKEELSYLYQGFVRYYVSVGNIHKAAEWAEEIIDNNGLQGDLLIRNLKTKFGKQPEILSGIIAGLFAQRMQDQQKSLPATVIIYGIKEQVADYINRKTRQSQSKIIKSFWRSTFQFARLIWRLRPS